MLKGKSAIVTGSTSGIGLGIARAFAAAGANVMLNGFGKPEEIEQVRAALAGDNNVKVGFSGADMSKGEQVEQMVRDAEKAFGQVDILVNNAGIQFVAPVTEFPAEKWSAVLAIDLSSNFFAIKAALPGMRARKWGRIVNVSSAHGLVGSPFKSAYVSAKHGVVGLTKTTALEAATFGITCNAICPGWVHTPLVQSQIDARAQQRRISQDRAIAELVGEKQPNGRMVTVEEIGALAVFLAGDLARSITGVAIPIDGGWTAQ